MLLGNFRSNRKKSNNWSGGVRVEERIPRTKHGNVK